MWDGTVSGMEFQAESMAFLELWNSADSASRCHWQWQAWAESTAGGYLALEDVPTSITNSDSGIAVESECLSDLADTEAPKSDCRGDSADDATLVFDPVLNNQHASLTYHVIYSESYKVPTLFFRGFYSDGGAVNMEDVQRILRADSLLLLEKSPWIFLTQEEHPVLHRPWLSLHPCGTSHVMALILSDWLKFHAEVDTNQPRRVSLGGDVSTMHPNHHGPLHDMVDTYGQHGADNLSLWLTNAKEAAAKITQATKARQREKEEKYGKFLRDLHSRLALFSKEKHLSKIPQARPRRLPFGQIDNSCNLRRSECDGPAVHERGRYLDPIFKEMPKMDKVRVYLEKQLPKNSKGGNGISKLHRECMIQALVKQRAMDSLVEKAYPNYHTSGDKITAPKKTDFTFSKPLPRPLIVSLSATDRAQAPDLVNSEPCTPTGWNLIPTSFSALEMRSIDSATSPTPPDVTEAGDLEANFSQALSRQSKDNPQHVHVESRGGRVLGRSQSSLSRFSGGGHTHMRGKDNIRSNTSAGSWSVRGNPKTRTREPLGHFVSRDSKRKQSQIETSVSCSGLSSEGVTTCPMGVVVLKGREEYETHGQGKQFFSDVWKCAMEVERRCAHERAHSLHILKKKRLEQQKAEKRHKAELLREKSIARQREAVKMQLKSVAALKARREGIVQRHRAVERKRFSHALQAIRTEKMQGYALQVPPLCNCGHGVHPLNVNYIKKCYIDCPLRNNFSEYALRLENKLQQLLDEFNASLYSTNDLHWPSTHEFYSFYDSCC